MGREGCSVSIVEPREKFILDKFSRKLGIEMVPVTLYGGEVLVGQESDLKEKGKGKQTRRSTSKNNLGRSNDKSIDRAGASSPAEGSHRDEVRRTADDPSKASVFGSREGFRQNDSRKGKPHSHADDSRKPKKSLRQQRREAEFQRKNKGAPRWLKEKWKQDTLTES